MRGVIVLLVLCFASLLTSAVEARECRVRPLRAVARVVVAPVRIAVRIRAHRVDSGRFLFIPGPRGIGLVRR